MTAVDRLHFAVAPGEIFGLVGPDGAGKTTTMRMLAGVMAPDAGSATVAGFDVVRDPEGVKHHISYMPQRFGLYEDLTVDENIRFYADLFGVAGASARRARRQLLAAAGMAPFRDRLAGQLSGGMKQKLGLTCALIHTPRVLLLDEPTTGVDPVSRRDFWRILYGLAAEGVTVLASTAYLDEAERCDRLALLHQGRLLLCDTPARLKAAMPGAVLAVTAPAPARGARRAPGDCRASRACCWSATACISSWTMPRAACRRSASGSRAAAIPFAEVVRSRRRSRTCSWRRSAAEAEDGA